MKLIRMNTNTIKAGWMFYCPACTYSHIFYDSGWTFDNNLETPSFTPALKNSFGTNVCDLNITSGEIIYQTDSTHALSGQTVQMIDYNTLGISS
jgi:hypothetical protein